MPRYRRLLALNVALVMTVGLVTGHLSGDQHRSGASVCGPRASELRLGNGPLACVHEDEAPEGVDVTAPVATADLKARPGAGPGAVEAAETLGVASPTYVASTATSPTVPCDGDGASGFRVQPMYVVEAGKTNRYSSLASTFENWAAGVDDVINRSAALSGGVRHVRYVTDTLGDGSCVAHVLNVTVPAGSMTSFGATISAVQALGFTSPARKYMMWTDATLLCGIATMYPGDIKDQTNPNNGSYAQYARIDSGCWGLGDGAAQHSVEAHELTHTIGGVQNTAPHSTQAGHCWDEADTMCYADGGNHAMVSVCPVEREYLLDCNLDDYFSTYPDPGSYLDTHWNAANSQFLIGGGNGTTGGVAGSPTVLGATIGVNNPAVPGLATQVSVTPSLPTGRTLTSVTWKSGRTDCVFSTPTLVQSDVTCAATASGSTTVTATLVDSTGATKSVSSPLTFLTGTARPVSVAFSVDSQTTSTVSLCTGVMAPFTVTATDSQTGLPIKGLTVGFTSQTATQTTAYAAGSVFTAVTGSGTLSKSTSVATTYVAKTAAGTVYAASAPVTRAATVGQCAPTLTASAPTATIYYGDPVTVTGTLTRLVNGLTIPVSGASIPVTQVKTTTTSTGTTTTLTTLGTAKTGADGSFSINVKPTATALLRAGLAGSLGYVATSKDLSTVTVLLPSTQLTGAVDKTDVGYGSVVTVTGSLRRIAGTSDTPLAGSTVSVKVTPTGGTTALAVASGRVATDGSFTIPVALKTTGTMSVAYAGVTGQPAAATAIGSVTAGTWTPSIAFAASTTSVLLGTSAKLTATVTRSYNGATGVAPSVTVKFYFLSAVPGSVPTLVSSGVTSATTGVAALTVYPRATGSWYAVISGVAGYSNTTSTSNTITVA